MMSLKKITAIIRTDSLEDVENHLRDIGVKGISVSATKGFGEAANFPRRDGMETHARIEIFADDRETGAITEVILDQACTGCAGDGIVAVTPVDEVIRIRNRQPLTSPERPVVRASPDPRTTASRSALRYAITIIGALTIAAVFFVAAQHRLHFLTAALLAIGVLSLLLFPTLSRAGRGKRES